MHPLQFFRGAVALASAFIATLVLVAGLSGTAAWAQTAAEPVVSAPAAPTLPAPKPKRHGSAKWWGSDVTPGWALMTWKERNEHRKRMRSAKTYDECKAYLDEHHAKMAERAKEKGKGALAEPKRDACAPLKP